MIGLVAGEWLKLRTVRAHQVLLVVAAAFPLGIVTLATTLTSSPEVFGDRGFVELVTGTTIVTGLLLAIAVAVGLTGEHAHGTIRVTYAITPSRPRVLVAKLLVGTVAAAVCGAVVVAAVWSLGAFVLSRRGAGVGLSWSDGTLGSVLAVVVLTVLMTWFGLGIAGAVRSTPGTVTIVLLWPLLVENILSLVGVLVGWSGIARWMPYQAALAAVGPSPSGLGRPMAFVWFAAVCSVLLAASAVLETRRDA